MASIPKKQIRWKVARSQSQAAEALAKADKDLPGRGYDAVFCDLQIPGEDGKVSRDNGLDVVRMRSQKTWPGTTIVLTQFATDPTALKIKAAQRNLIFDEWLLKEADLIQDQTDGTHQQWPNSNAA